MQRHWWTPILLIVTCPVMGAFVGILTNLVNGRVSPDYFAILMWWRVQDVPRRVVFQGILEGGVLGAAVGILLAISAAASTKFYCPLGLGLAKALRAAGIALVCWVIGGVCGVILASYLGPVTYGQMFPVASGFEGNDLRRVAWVGGSIWGAYAGSVIGLAYAAVALHVAWRRRLRESATAGFAVLPTKARQ